MYDYGARNYEPALGRWMNIDPLAGKYQKWSPYTYCIDNPVYFIDLDGRRWASAQAEKEASEMVAKANGRIYEAEFEKFQAENEYEVSKVMGLGVIASTRELLGKLPKVLE